MFNLFAIHCRLCSYTQLALHNLVFIVVLLVVLVSAASSAKARPASSQNSTAVQPFMGGDPAPGTGKIRTVEIEMTLISFSVRSVDVRAGETIRFVISNTSFIPHDFTIGISKTQQARRAILSEMLKSESLDHDDGGSTKFDRDGSVLVFPGETKELVRTFAEAQHLEFGCNMSGHYEMGMRGDILIRPTVDLPVVISTVDRHLENLSTQRQEPAPTIEQSVEETRHASPQADSETNAATLDSSLNDQAVKPLKPAPQSKTATIEQSVEERRHASPPTDSETNAATLDSSLNNQTVEPLKPAPQSKTATIEQSVEEKRHASPPVDGETNAATLEPSHDDQAVQPVRPTPQSRTATLDPSQDKQAVDPLKPASQSRTATNGQSVDANLHTPPPVETQANAATLDPSQIDQEVDPGKQAPPSRTATLPSVDVRTQKGVHRSLQSHLEAAKARRRQLLLKHGRKVPEY